MWRHPNSLKFCILLAIVCQMNLSCIYRGCRDTDAENYKPKATVDCGCCVYYSKAHIWYTLNYHETNMRNKIVKLRYYVDSVFIQETTGNLVDFSRSAPIEEKKFDEFVDINTDGENLLTINLRGQKSREVLIDVKDQNDSSFFSQRVILKGNRFIGVEIK